MGVEQRRSTCYAERDAIGWLQLVSYKSFLMFEHDEVYVIDMVADSNSSISIEKSVMELTLCLTRTASS